jgi:hypothetical protein
LLPFFFVFSADFDAVCFPDAAAATRPSAAAAAAADGVPPAAATADSAAEDGFDESAVAAMFAWNGLSCELALTDCVACWQPFDGRRLTTEAYVIAPDSVCCCCSFFSCGD